MDIQKLTQEIISYNSFLKSEESIKFKNKLIKRAKKFKKENYNLNLMLFNLFDYFTGQNKFVKENFIIERKRLTGLDRYCLEEYRILIKKNAEYCGENFIVYVINYRPFDKRLISIKEYKKMYSFLNSFDTIKFFRDWYDEIFSNEIKILESNPK